MPKIKTHKGTAKRIRITKGGKIKRRRASQSHNLEKKSATRKRVYRKPENISKADVKRIRKLIQA